MVRNVPRTSVLLGLLVVTSVLHAGVEKAWAAGPASVLVEAEAFASAAAGWWTRSSWT